MHILLKETTQNSLLLTIHRKKSNKFNEYKF
jgi:hypothetical protein